jgi:hypothetical protein
VESRANLTNIAVLTRRSSRSNEPEGPLIAGLSLFVGLLLAVVVFLLETPIAACPRADLGRARRALARAAVALATLGGARLLPAPVLSGARSGRAPHPW